MALRNFRQYDDTQNVIHCYFAPDALDDSPIWLTKIVTSPDVRRVFDWRSADYSAAALLHERQRTAFPTDLLLRTLRPGLVVLAAWALLEVVATTLTWGHLSVERTRLMAEQTKLFHSAMGEQASMVDGARQLLHRLDSQRIALGQPAPADVLVLAKPSGTAIAYDAAFG